MNKRHISTILFEQNQNSKFLKLEICPLHFSEYNFYRNTISIIKSKSLKFLKIQFKMFQFLSLANEQ